MNRLSRLVLPPFVLLATFTVPAVAAKDRPPNVVLILVDDLGWSDLGCYGNTFHETPAIDRLAGQGMRFTDAYAACCVCSPTRASILTGKYPARLHLTDFIPGHPRPWARLIPPAFNLQLPLEEVTIAEALKPAGYTSAMFGKWHLGNEGYEPSRQGFDVAMVHRGGHIFPNFRLEPPMSLEKGDYLADVLTDRALAFIQGNRERPFFLLLSHYAVHIPLQARPDLIAGYEARPRPGRGVNHPVYAAMLESVDQSVDRVTTMLDDLGLTENTLLVFVSDNGGLIRMYTGAGDVVTTNEPLRREKGTQYEGGIRVPMIVRWPGHVEPGTLSDEPVSTIDLFPTILEAAGVPVDDPDFDGVSLRPVLEGEGGLDRDALYWHYPHYHHGTPAGVIRQGDYKLIERYEDGYLELYHLGRDIGERVNLAESIPDKAKEMRGKLHQWLLAVDAQMMKPNPDFDPLREFEWGHRFHRPEPRVPAAATFHPVDTIDEKSPDGEVATDKPYSVNVPSDLLDGQGTVSLWFKTTIPLDGPGENRNLIKGDPFETFISPRDGNTWMLFHSGPAMTGKDPDSKANFYWFGAALTHLKADRWYHAAWTWDAKDPRRNNFILDGIQQTDGADFAFDGILRPAGKDCSLTIGTEGLVVGGISMYDRPLAERELQHLCDMAGHTTYTDEGLSFTGEFFVPRDVDYEHPVYSCEFDSSSDLDDWTLEGGVKASVADGNLVLESTRESTRSEARANHLVYWLEREMPADFMLEFTVRPEDRHRGLNIVFFNTRGRDGQGIFDPSLARRDGTFNQYHSGDLDNYHISYWAGGRGTANCRKNHGFRLVAVGKELIYNTDDNAFQTVRLYKRGGKIRLTVDDLVSIAFDDDGERYGPVHTHAGWIGLRQMAHTQKCEYGYVRVYPLKSYP